MLTFNSTTASKSYKGMYLYPLLKKNESKFKVVGFGLLIHQNVGIDQEKKNMQSNFNILTFFKVKRSQMSIFCIHFGIFFGHCSLKHFRCIQQAVCQIFSFYHQTHNFSTNLLDYYVYHVINLLLILELSEPNQY